MAPALGVRPDDAADGGVVSRVLQRWRRGRVRATADRGLQRMLIPGVEVRPLNVIADDRGAVLHMLRADAPHFQRFGEIYFSIVNPGAVKAWRRHRSAVMNLAVPVAHVATAGFDDRSASPA